MSQEMEPFWGKQWIYDSVSTIRWRKSNMTICLCDSFVHKIYKKKIGWTNEKSKNPNNFL